MANTTIALKKSSTPGAIPTTNALSNGELAINYADGILYYKNVTGQIVSVVPTARNFGIVNANGTLLTACTAGDVLSVVAGQNISITSNTITDTFTISADIAPANSWANTVGSSVNNYTSATYATLSSLTATTNSLNSNWAVTNAIFAVQNSDFTITNTAFTVANAAFSSGNTTLSSLNSNWAVTNAAFTVANSSNGWTNTVGTAANNYAIATFYSKSGGTISGDVAITGNLTISGNTTYTNTQTLLIGDNIVVLNADLPGNVTPIENAGIEVNRGNKASNAQILWIEAASAWAFTDNNRAAITTYIASNADVATVQSSLNSNWAVTNTIFATQNSNFTVTNTAFTRANVAANTANAGFTKANTALANTSGVAFAGDLSFPTGNVAVGSNTTTLYKLYVNGSFAANTKSFVIDHPTKHGMKLRYGSLEGPENGVYIRGKLEGSNTIQLPEYWKALVNIDSITVNLTPVKSFQNLSVESVDENEIIVKAWDNQYINCYYHVFAERKDVDKLIVEY